MVATINTIVADIVVAADAGVLASVVAAMLVVAFCCCCYFGVGVDVNICVDVDVGVVVAVVVVAITFFGVVLVWCGVVVAQLVSHRTCLQCLMNYSKKLA